MATGAVEHVRNQVQATAAGNGSGPTVIDLIKQMQPAIEKALPNQLDGERFARIALTLVRSTPKLAECEPMSFIGSLMVAAQLGLEPGPPLGLSWIIPRKNSRTNRMEANFQLGYKGVIELFGRSGQFKSIQAHEVCEKDEFEFAYGVDAFLRHKPTLREDRGPSYAFYAVAHFVNGGNAFVVLPKAEVERRRQRGQDGPAWRTDYDAMGRKTAVLALAPWVPLSPELERALATDGRSFSTVEPNMADQLPAIEAAEVDVPDDEIEAEVVDEEDLDPGREF